MVWEGNRRAVSRLARDEQMVPVLMFHYKRFREDALQVCFLRLIFIYKCVYVCVCVSPCVRMPAKSR